MISNQNISVAIITFNEERNIAQLIDSLDWIEEIVVVDSYSTDCTTALLEQSKAKVYQRKFDNFSNQKNYAIEQCSNDWVILLDADERISNELKEELLNLELSQDIQNYQVGRINYYMGKRVRFCGWKNDIMSILINKKFCSFNGASVHEGIDTNGQISHLKNKLTHHTYTSYEKTITKQNQYSTLYAEQKMKGKSGFSFIKIIVKPPFKFISIYLFKLGFLDGKVGFIIAAQTASEMLMRCIKMWRISLEKNNK